MNNITVIRTKRKTISIKVNNDLTVTVRAPFLLLIKKSEKF